MPFDCPSARGRRGQCVICSRLWIDYIGRIHKAREIRCNLSKTMQSDQAGVAAAIDCDGSFRLGHGIICGIVGGDYRKTIGCGAVVALLAFAAGTVAVTVQLFSVRSVYFTSIAALPLTVQSVKLAF